MSTETIITTPTTVKDVQHINMPFKEQSEVSRLVNEDGSVNLALLSEEQIKKYKEIGRDLKVTDINSISNYGVELQNAMQRYSNEFLSSVRTQQSGEIGTLVDQLLKELDYIDVDELKAPSSFMQAIRKVPILGKLVSNVSRILRKYDNIAENIETISKKIAATRITSLRDNNALQIMFENNLKYGEKVEELIIGGKLKLNEVQTQIDTMLQNPSSYQPHQIQDAQEFANNLECRLTDMVMLRYIIKQSLPQIRTVQYNNIAIADKAQSIISTTIPVWRNQLSISVALYNQRDRINAHTKVTETTNLIIKKNAELLHQNSIEVAKETEKSVVSIEALRESTQKLIQTIQDVKRIHEEGHAKRQAAESEIMKIEQELEQKMSYQIENR